MGALILKVFSDAGNDVVFNMKCSAGVETIGNNVAQLAAELCKEHAVADKLEGFALYLSECFAPILNVKGTRLAADREKVCMMMHGVIVSKTLALKWASVVCCVNPKPNISQIMCTYTVKKVFENLCEWRSSLIDDLSTKETSLRLSPQEEKVLRYVAGFIPFSIGKKYRNRNSTVSQAIMMLLESWKAVDDDRNCAPSFLDYTNSWCDKINRGGLFLVNDEFYIFIRRIEDVARTVFNKNLIKTYKGEDLRDVLMERFKENSFNSFELGYFDTTFR